MGLDTVGISGVGYVVTGYVDVVGYVVTGYVDLVGYVVTGYVETSCATTADIVNSAAINTSMIRIRFFVFIVALCIVFQSFPGGYILIYIAELRSVYH